MAVRPPVVRLSLGCLVLLASLGACAANDTSVGTGYLDVADLRDPPFPHHFTAQPVELEGQLSLRTRGCVTVVVDGVERMPLWPDGTAVAQDPANRARYTVALPGGITLSVDDTSSDGFSARGIIDDNPEPFEVEAGLPTKVSSFLAYCGVQALPVAFPDAATFTTRKA